jgi:hypothetical protein
MAVKIDTIEDRVKKLKLKQFQISSGNVNKIMVHIYKPHLGEYLLVFRAGRTQNWPYFL